MNKKISFALGGLLASVTCISFLIGCNGNTPGKSGYSVTFHAGTGYTINGSEEFTENNVGKIEREPTPDFFEGQRFTGWFTSKDCKTGQVSFPYTVTSNVNLYAKWEIDYKGGFTVCFDSNGGTEVPKYIVNEDSQIAGEPFTSKENYKFNGWKEKSTDLKTIKFPYTPKRDITLVADYTQVNFKVRLHTIGEQPKGTKQAKNGDEIYYETEATKEIKTPPLTSRSGYIFTGWYDNPELKNDPVQFPYAVTEDKCDLYAGFDDSSVVGPTVTLNDGEATKELTNITRLPYAPEPISDIPSKKFLGWSLTPDGPIITDYSSLKFETDTDLYAKWSDRTKVSIEFMDDDGTTLIKKVDYYQDDVINDAPQFNEKSYFDFNGWYTDKAKKNKQSFPLTIDEASTPRVLYSDSTRNSFDLVVKDSETGSIFASSSQSKINNISTIASPDLPSDRKGDYVFDYYSFNQDGTGERVGRERSFNVNSKEIKNNQVVLYAQWNKNKRKYKFNLDYGDKENSIKTNKATVNVKDIPTIKDEHKTIIGWRDVDSKEEFMISTEVDIPTKERTLEAIWLDKERSITVYRGGADSQTYTAETVSGLVREGLTLGKIPVDTLSKPQYKFLGFYFENPITSEDKPDIKSIETPIPDTQLEIWEAWEIDTATVTVNYIDKSEYLAGLIHSEQRTVPMTFNFSDIKATITDYERDDSLPLYLNGEKLNDDDITLTQKDNVITCYVNKVAFKITYITEFYEKTDTHYETSVTEISDYKPQIEETYFRFLNWFDEYGYKRGEGEKVTEDTILHANWEDTRESESSFDITFSVGSTQLLAGFNDNSRNKTMHYQGTIESDDFPVATCPGNVFDGWWSQENGGERYTSLSKTHRPNSDKLYAHWKPATGYFPVALKLGEDGLFTESKNSTGLISVDKTTTWGQIKNNLPEATFSNNEYTVAYWSLTPGGSELADDYTFTPPEGTNPPTVLYATQKENILAPKDFNTDNWATLINVANNNVKKDDGVTPYANGYEAFTQIYKNSFDVFGLRPLEYDNFEVRIIAGGQDYGDSSGSTVLPISLEISTIFDISSWDDSATESTWTKSPLKKKLTSTEEGGTGEFYKLMPKILRTHFATAYKATSKSSLTANKLFIPSAYEINITKDENNQSTKINNLEFIYTWYAEVGKEYLPQAIMKDYIVDKNPVSYWLRNGSGNYLKIEQNRETKTNYYIYANAAKDTGRGVNIMFCLGAPYKKPKTK